MLTPYTQQLYFLNDSQSQNHHDIKEVAMNFVWMKTIYFYGKLSDLGKFLTSHHFPDSFGTKLMLRNPHVSKELSMLI